MTASLPVPVEPAGRLGSGLPAGLDAALAAGAGAAPIPPTEVPWLHIWQVHPIELAVASFAIVLAIVLALALWWRNRQLRAARQAALASERRWLLALDGAGHGVWDWDIAADRVFYSRRWKEMLGYREDELGERSSEWRDRVHPADLPAVLAGIERHLRGEAPRYRGVFRMRARDGSLRSVLGQGMVFARAADGEPLRMVGTHTDVTAWRAAEDGLAAQRDLFAAVVSQARDGVVVIDAETQGFVEFNDAACAALGYDRAGFAQLCLADIQAELAPTAVSERLAAIIAAGHASFDTRHRHRDGSIRDVRASNQVIQRDGRVLLAAIWADVTEAQAAARALQQSEASLRQLALYDPLTGLANRRLLLDRLTQAIVVADRNRRALAVCSLDLDDFKPINARFGQAAGDALLTALGQRLRSALAAGDTAARWGGDEFVLLLTGLDGAADCERRLRRLLQQVEEPFVVGADGVADRSAGADPGRAPSRAGDACDDCAGDRCRVDAAIATATPVRLSASIGVALYPADRGDADALLRHADHAMFLAKQRGAGGYQFFDPVSDSLAGTQRDALRRVDRAIDLGELRLHYQPIVNMRTGAVVGVEALVRWQHPSRGLLGPDRFLSVLEGTPVICRLDHWVLTHALADLATWAGVGLALQLHVNVSAETLTRPGFIGEVAGMVAAHPRLRLDQVGIEVLETAALKDVQAVTEVIRAGRAIGLGFALDDFGTGYSSLTYVRHLPANVLKIDQSFVRNMLIDHNDQHIVEAVIGLARAFDRGIIAEGVESEAHGLLLLRFGCEQAQGFGIARPMPPARLPAWIADYRAPAQWCTTAAQPWPGPDQPLLSMAAEHRSWVAAVLDRVLSTAAPAAASDTPPVDEQHCRFGRWYAANGRRRYGHLAAFRAIEPLHSEVHRLGAALLDRQRRGAPPDGVQVAQLEQVSEALIEQIKRIEDAVTARAAALEAATELPALVGDGAIVPAPEPEPAPAPASAPAPTPAPAPASAPVPAPAAPTGSWQALPPAPPPSAVGPTGPDSAAGPDRTTARPAVDPAAIS